MQVTSIAPTNSNRHPISSSQHNSLNRPDQKCCQSNCPYQKCSSSFTNRHNQSKTNTPKSFLPTPIKITDVMKPTAAPQNVQTHFVQYLTRYFACATTTVQTREGEFVQRYTCHCKFYHEAKRSSRAGSCSGFRQVSHRIGTIKY